MRKSVLEINVKIINKINNIIFICKTCLTKENKYCRFHIPKFTFTDDGIYNESITYQYHFYYDEGQVHISNI